MQKKLVSILSVMTVLSTVPAMSATNEVNGGPTNFQETDDFSGYYLKDTEYKNAANGTNLGSRYTTDGAEFNLFTEWTEDKYKVNPGYYLPADSEGTTEKCANGYYCPGSTGDGFTFSTSAQGLSQCPTDYANSEKGASANTDCYRTCEAGDVANAETVSGGVYYNRTEKGNNQCSAETCKNGYHKESGGVNLTDTIGTIAGNGYTANTSTGDEYITDNMSNSIIAGEPMAYAVDYGAKGIVKGHGRCSTQPGDNNNNTWTNPTIVDKDEELSGNGTGQYCYCNVTSYKASDGSEMSLSSSWVFNNGAGDADFCASDCAEFCASYVCDVYDDQLRFRAALFGSVGASGPATCEANKYKLNWKGTDGTTTVTTETEYNASITSPKDAPERKGHTFKGWKLQKSVTTNE